MQFTERFVKSLKPADGQTKPRDVREKSGSGFGVTVFPSGEKSFIYIYHFGGRKRRMTLGKYPHCPLIDARKLHRDALTMLEAGKDPALEKRKEKITARDSSTVEGLIDEYIEHWAKPRKRSWEADLRTLNVDIKPFWGKLKASDITRRDVIVRLDAIKERGASIQANRVLACVRRMFNFAIERDIITASPCVAVKAVSAENRRERLLSVEEIQILWSALDNDPMQKDNLHIIHMSPQTKLVLKFQFATAQRKGEVVGAEWSEIDLVTGWWTIPGAKAKNKQTHRVPLSPLAVDLLNEIKQLSGESRFLFPAKRKDAHITGSSVDHAVRRTTIEGVTDWTPHDIRRGVASHMTAMGISRLTVSKILNHSESSSVTAIYDRHTYDQEKRLALDGWSQRLNEIIYGVDPVTNVITLKAAI